MRRSGHSHAHGRSVSPKLHTRCLALILTDGLKLQMVEERTERHQVSCSPGRMVCELDTP